MGVAEWHTRSANSVSLGRNENLSSEESEEADRLWAQITELMNALERQPAVSCKCETCGSTLEICETTMGQFGTTNSWIVKLPLCLKCVKAGNSSRRDTGFRRGRESRPGRTRTNRAG